MENVLNGGTESLDAGGLDRFDSTFNSLAAAFKAALAQRYIVAINMAVHGQKLHVGEVLYQMEDRIRTCAARVKVQNLLALEKFAEQLGAAVAMAEVAASGYQAAR